MRKLDLDLIRRVIRVRIDGNDFDVSQPTLKQKMQYEKERIAIFQDSAKLREQEKFEEALKIELDFLVREMEILAPTIPSSVVEEMTSEQRDVLLFEIMKEGDEEEEKPTGTKKKKGRG